MKSGCSLFSEPEPGFPTQKNWCRFGRKNPCTACNFIFPCYIPRSRMISWDSVLMFRRKGENSRYRATALESIIFCFVSYMNTSLYLFDFYGGKRKTVRRFEPAYGLIWWAQQIWNTSGAGRILKDVRRKCFLISVEFYFFRMQQWSHLENLAGTGMNRLSLP